MKNVKKIFLLMLVLLFLFCVTEVSASAKSILQDGLNVSIVTEKQSYESTEGISAKLSVTNTNHFDVKNLQLEILTPEGYSLQEKSNGSMQMEVLSSGQSAELNTVFILNSSNGTPQDTTPHSTNMGMIILIIVGAAVVILVATVFTILLLKKRTKKLFSFVFLLLALGAAAMPKSLEVKAVETNEKTITITETIVVNGIEQLVEAKIQYILPVDKDSTDKANSTDKTDTSSKTESSLSEADSYYQERAEVISVTNVKDAENILSEQEVTSLFAERGFEDYGIQTEYDENGNVYDEKEYVGDEPQQKHPLYEMYYISENEMIWTIYNVNGTIYAYPVSYNLVSERKAPLLVTETDTVIGYDNETNQYYETIPNSTSVIVMKVEKINKEVLDNMTLERLGNYES